MTRLGIRWSRRKGKSVWRIELTVIFFLVKILLPECIYAAEKLLVEFHVCAWWIASV